ncbi:hypothetical protein FHS00_001305 [Limimaricola variabilis]|uniref:Uncharacterized protein n=1 Tax=Limimaricola variabilis TaxID=1492771 RepID=A0ABR6HN22_9RHOB|nr:hypothetical protein [Limimaricola variabilis]MBB3711734.1 hypothetical protein [Limimaricola variabilis]
MTITDAEDWAFTFTANSIRDRINDRKETIDTIAYNLFDHDLEVPSGNRLSLTKPNDQCPALYVEKLVGSDCYDIVIEWKGVELHRSQIEEELLWSIEKFF